MKRYLLPVFLIFFLSSSIFSQTKRNDFSIKWSPDVKYKSSARLIGGFETSDGFLVFSKETIHGPGGYKYIIQLFSSDMTLNKTIDISKNINEKLYTILDAFKYGNNFIIITSRVFKKEKREEIYLQKINGQDASISKRTLIHKDTYDKKRKKPSYKLESSPNDKYLLIESIPPPVLKNPGHLGLVLLDENLAIQWQNDNVTLAVKQPNFDMTNMVVSDAGDIYLLGKSYDRKELKPTLFHANKSKSYNSIPFELIRIDKEGSSSAPLKFTKPGILGLRIKFSKDNVLHCAGYFTKDLKKRDLAGVVSYTIKNMEISREDSREFSKQLIFSRLSEKAKNKLQKKLDRGKDVYNQLEPVKFLQNKDGSITLVGEIFYVVVYTTSSPNGGSTTHYKYHYADLYITNISQSGEIISNAIIRKDNVYSRPVPEHNLLYSIDNRFVYVSYKHRKDFLNADPAKRKKDLLLYATTVNKEGDVKEGTLFNFSDDKEHKRDRIKNFNKRSFFMKNGEPIIMVIRGHLKYAYMRVITEE